MRAPLEFENGNSKFREARREIKLGWISERMEETRDHFIIDLGG